MEKQQIIKNSKIHTYIPGNMDWIYLNLHVIYSFVIALSHSIYTPDMRMCLIIGLCVVDQFLSQSWPVRALVLAGPCRVFACPVSLPMYLSVQST